MRTLIAAALASSLAAQAHLRVPQQFAEITAAIRAAQPGDEIWVTYRSTGYAPIVVDKPVTIMGLGSESQTPTIYASTGPAIDVRLAADQSVHIARIDAYSPNTTAAPTIVVNGGRVVFEDAHMARNITSTSIGDMVLAQNADLVLMRSRFESGSGASLRAVNSHVTAIHTIFYAGNSSQVPAIELTSSTLHGSEVFAAGSEGFAPQTPGGPAIVADAQSRVWLTNSTLRGGVGTPGASAMVNHATVAAAFMDSVLTGGAPFNGGTQAPPAVGPVNMTAGLLAASQPPRAYRTFGSLHLGGDCGFTFTAAAGTPLLVLWSDHLVRAYTHPLLVQPTHMPATAGVLAVAGANFSLVVNVPNDPALLGRALWIHGIGGTSLPLQVAPLMGGVLRI